MAIKISKDTRKEPTMTKSLQQSYEVSLRRLFKNFRSKAVEALEQSRMLEASAAQVNTGWLADRLRDLGLVTIIIPGKNIVDDHVWKSYTAGTTYSGYALKRVGVNMQISNGPADWRVIDNLRVRNLNALRGINDEMSKQIIHELTTGIQKGESIPDLAGRIKDRVDNIGITRATTMARTETITAFNSGSELRYQQAGVTKVQWITATDERVCPRCGPLDGKVFSLDSNFDRAPLHPNCRCTYVAVIEK